MSSGRRPHGVGLVTTAALLDALNLPCDIELTWFTGMVFVYRQRNPPCTGYSVRPDPRSDYLSWLLPSVDLIAQTDEKSKAKVGRVAK